MDIGTLLGIVSGMALIIYSIMMGSSLMVFWDLPSFLIVIGGTIATTFIKFNMKTVFGTVGVLKNAFFDSKEDPQKVIKQLVDMANKARKESILSLASYKITQDLMRKGTQLIVDGIAPDLVKSILYTEIAFMKSRHQSGQKLFKAMGSSAPAFGMIGTLIGLVQMLQSMSDPANIGPAMAVALITTFYGALFSNLVFLPIADKLEMRSGDEQLIMQIMVEGVLSIQAGDNPRVLEEKLLSFLSPDMRGGKKKGK